MSTTTTTDFTPRQLDDIMQRQNAGLMADALWEYETAMQNALNASRKHGDERSATMFRCDARAALHRFPQLLAMVQATTSHTMTPFAARSEVVARLAGENANPHAVTGMWLRMLNRPQSVVERVGEWTRR